MRGTRHLAAPGLNPFEIIPACAGNIAARCAPCSPGRDHPRACGEHWLLARSACSTSGSSPRVRGTSLHDLLPPHGDGIIPACAGNMFGFCAFARSAWDHPRVCGEHSVVSAWILQSRGSSPRVRGTPPSNSGYNSLHGIIPACAGNTTTTPWRRPTRRDHPRVCGEHQPVNIST